MQCSNVSSHYCYCCYYYLSRAWAQILLIRTQQGSPLLRRSGSGQFRFQPWGGIELERQLTVTDHLGQPARFTSLSVLEQGQNTLQHSRKATCSSTEKQTLCLRKPQADADSWLKTEDLQDQDMLHPVYSLPRFPRLFVYFRGLKRH